MLTLKDVLTISIISKRKLDRETKLIERYNIEGRSSYFEEKFYLLVKIWGRTSVFTHW